MMHRALLIILLIFLLPGCSARYIVPNNFKSMPPIPSEWEPLPLTENYCSNLQGSFQQFYDAYEYTHKQFKKLHPEKFRYIQLLNHRVELVKTRLPKKVPESDFQMDISLKNNIFKITVHHAKGLFISSKSFNIEEHGYKCSNNKLIYPKSEFLGGGDGTLINYRRHRELYISKTGDLIFYEQTGNMRNSIFSPDESNTRHIFHIIRRQR